MEPTDLEPTRALQAAVGQAVQAHPPEGLEGAVLVGWVIVADWLPADGPREISRAVSEGLPSWVRNGMLEDAAGDWNVDDDD